MARKTFVSDENMIRTTWSAYGYLSYARYTPEPISPKYWAGGGASAKALVRELNRIANIAATRDIKSYVLVPLLQAGRPYVYILFDPEVQGGRNG